MHPRPIVTRLPPCIAWNIQGSSADARFMECVQGALGVPLPATPNSMVQDAGVTACWLGPRSWLVFFSPGVQARRAQEIKAIATRIAAGGGALFEVGASRVAYEVDGPMSVELLARFCPLDFDVASFAPGTVAQSLLEHINALYIRHDEHRFTVMVARSFAADSLALLLQHAQSDS